MIDVPAGYVHTTWLSHSLRHVKTKHDDRGNVFKWQHKGVSKTFDVVLSDTEVTNTANRKLRYFV